MARHVARRASRRHPGASVTDGAFESRIRRFQEAIAVLETLALTDQEAFLADPVKWGAAERFLQMAVEILTDLGAHVVVRGGAAKIVRNRDVPDGFLERGWLTADQAALWRRIIGFRNVIVHDYLDVDRRLTHDILRSRLPDLHTLLRAVVAAARASGALDEP